MSGGMLAEGSKIRGKSIDSSDIKRRIHSSFFDVVWRISLVICLRIRGNAGWRGGGGGMRRGHQPIHTVSVRQRASRERERERERRGLHEHVGGREVLGRDLFRILLRSGVELGFVINWGVDKRCFLCLFGSS